MKRIEVNVMTGEIREIELTPEEAAKLFGSTDQPTQDQAAGGEEQPMA